MARFFEQKMPKLHQKWWNIFFEIPAIQRSFVHNPNIVIPLIIELSNTHYTVVTKFLRLVCQKKKP